MPNTTKNTALGREIGVRIMQLRAGNAEKQEELAAAIGVSREIIQHWESGTRHIKAEHIIALANHFNTSADYLLGRSEVQTSDTAAQKFAQDNHLSPKALRRITDSCKNPDSTRHAAFDALLSADALDKFLETIEVALSEMVFNASLIRKEAPVHLLSPDELFVETSRLKIKETAAIKDVKAASFDMLAASLAVCKEISNEDALRELYEEQLERLRAQASETHDA